MNGVFQVKSPVLYYQRDKNELYSRNPKAVTNETESVSFIAPKIWSIVPQELKKKNNLYVLSKQVLGNGNQTVHVGYTKTTCNMLVLHDKQLAG